MRNDFVRQILIEMERDPRIILLTGDLGFRAFEPVQSAFPDRFINVGIAEATMIGVAAGLAMTGKKPIAYSIASFASMRGYEQIRTDVCYHDLDVKIVGVGGGYNYSHQGVTHHTVEDLAIMRVLPTMKVICPATAWEASGATAAMLRDHGPTYLRLGKSPAKDFSRPGETFAIGKGYPIKDGSDVVLFCTGNTLELALDVAERAQVQLGCGVGVVSMPTLKPIDAECILNAAKQAKGLFTIEEHSVIGGLGSAVADVLIESRVSRPVFHAFGFPDRFIKDVGGRDYLLARAGLNPETISRTIAEKMSSV